MSGYEGRYLNHARSKMIGGVFGRLTVIDVDGRSKHGSYEWKCKCSCGNECVVSTNSLNMGNTRSCGCLLSDTTREIHTSHGLSNDLLYYVWRSMLDRCYKPNAAGYINYGGRPNNPISVCEEWKNDFLSFYNWAVNNGYQSGLTIERQNNNGNYEPGNCVWGTREQQSQNKRDTKLDPDSVRAIRKDNRSDIDIAHDYDIDPKHVYRVRTGRNWKNID